jgi:hypothetical protein
LLLLQLLLLLLLLLVSHQFKPAGITYTACTKATFDNILSDHKQRQGWLKPTGKHVTV